MAITQIQTGVIADGAITSSKLGNGVIGPEKLTEPLTRQGLFSVSGSLTNFDITALPAYTKRLTLMISQLSTSGTSKILIQLGSSTTFFTSGYLCNSATITAGTTTTSGGVLITNGIALSGAAPATAGLYTGHIIFTLLNTNPTTYVVSGTMADVTNNVCMNLVAGTSQFTDTSALNKIRLTTVNGTDTFDSGSFTWLAE